MQARTANPNISLSPSSQFHMLHKDKRAAMTAIQYGKRDQFISVEIPGFDILTEQDKPAVLQTTAAALPSKITTNSVLVHQDDIYAHGQGSVWLVTKDEKEVSSRLISVSSEDKGVAVIKREKNTQFIINASSGVTEKISHLQMEKIINLLFDEKASQQDGEEGIKKILREIFQHASVDDLDRQVKKIQSLSDKLLLNAVDADSTGDDDLELCQAMSTTLVAIATIAGSTQNVSVQVIHCKEASDAQLFAILDSCDITEQAQYLGQLEHAMLSRLPQSPASSVDEYKRYQLDAKDYSQVSKEIPFACAEVKGERPTQEDRIIVGEIAEFKQLSPEGRMAVLNDTAAILQKGTEKQGKCRQPGSTASIVVVCEDIYTGMLGDSTPFLIKVEEKGVTLNKLYERLHNVEDLKDAKPEVQARLQGKIFPIYHYQRFPAEEAVTVEQIDQLKDLCSFYLNGETQLYGAFGDNHVDGIMHQPDFLTYRTSKPAYILNACDGLTETISIEQLQRLVNIIFTHRDAFPLDEISSVLKEVYQEELRRLNALHAFYKDKYSKMLRRIDEDLQEVRANLVHVMDSAHAVEELAKDLLQKALLSDDPELALCQRASAILTAFAIIAGSRDNVSVLVAPVKKDQPARYYAIFDGHGGDEVSDHCAKHFHAVISQQIKLRLNAVAETLAKHALKVKNEYKMQPQESKLYRQGLKDAFNNDKDRIDKMLVMVNQIIGADEEKNNMMNALHAHKDHLIEKYCDAFHQQWESAKNAEDKAAISTPIEQVEKAHYKIIRQLFSEYINQYVDHRTSSGFFGSSSVIQSSYAKWLESRFSVLVSPDEFERINAELTEEKQAKITPLNSLLRYAGSHFPELVNKKVIDLVAMWIDGILPQRKAEFTNTVKLLQRLIPYSVLKNSKIPFLSAIAGASKTDIEELANQLVNKDLSKRHLFLQKEHAKMQSMAISPEESLCLQYKNYIAAQCDGLKKPLKKPTAVASPAPV